MLGFSQYSQVSYVAIIEQKMRVFFLSVFILSPRFAGLLQGALNGSGTLQSAVLDSLFAFFVQSLKEKNIYEEYLVPSVFIENINYDYVTNEDSRTLEIAEQNFKDTFFRILKEVVGNTSTPKEESEKPTTAFLSALLIAKKIRPIPEYKNDTFLKIPTNPLVEVGKPITSLFEDSSLIDSNMFYLETFYRLRDDVASTLFKNQILKAQFLSKSEALTYIKENKLKGLLSNNFVRGVRLMMNLTSLIEFTASSVPGISALGTNINLPAYNKLTLQKLPFLDAEFLEKLINIAPLDKNNKNYFNIQPFGTNQPAATVGKIKENVRLAFDIVKDKTNDKKSFSGSKSLVCVEDLGGDSSFVYFPISMSEFISNKINPTDVELANGLGTTTTYNEFFTTTNVAELVQIIQTLTRFFSINPIDFFDAANNSTIKSQNEALDNMITNLINFDEV
tara:strand:- start:13 stop:1359 length:1347 start_codon:yes stop_codon:yes gene_type:complete